MALFAEFLHQPECEVVLFGSANGDADTVVAHRHSVTAAENYAVVDHILLQLFVFGGAYHKEIGIAAKNFFDIGQCGYICHKTVALAHKKFNGAFKTFNILQFFYKRFLGKTVHIVGQFHLVDHSRQLFAHIAHAGTQGGKSPSL